MKAITSENTAVTAGQIKQISRLGSDALDKVLIELGLDNPGAQRVIEHGGEFAEAIRTAALASLKDLSVSDKYKNEEVESTYGYLSGYKPKNIVEQCNRLRELFPGLGYPSQELIGLIQQCEIDPPTTAESWFAIPNIWKDEVLKQFGGTYSQAVQKVLDTISTTRNGKFENYRKGQITEKQLRQQKGTAEIFRKLSEAQGDPDILIIEAQFGLRHRGRSVRRAREVFQANEFGLGAFVVGIMLLSHPERLMNYDDLWIDCSGDEFDDPDSDDRFARAPVFEFDDGEIEFGTDYVGHADEDYGSASGFVSQK